MVLRAFLGAGLLGRGMAEGALARGEKVRVWNRTVAAAEPLREHGATVCEEIADAIDGVDVIQLVLSNDTAVDATLEKLLPLAPTAPIVDHSTTSPAGAARRASRLRDAGHRFLHAPVFMSPTAARSSQGTVIVAGPSETFASVSEVLRPMCATLRHVGERPDQAAAMKLIGNAMNLSMLFGVADILKMANGLDLPPEEALDVFGIIDVRYVIEGRGRKMARRDDAPLWSVDIARKDLGLMMDCAPDADFGALRHLADALDALRERGLGDRDVAKLGIPDERDDDQS